jgi:hypothetical protein
VKLNPVESFLSDRRAELSLDGVPKLNPVLAGLDEDNPNVNLNPVVGTLTAAAAVVVAVAVVVGLGGSALGVPVAVPNLNSVEGVSCHKASQDSRCISRAKSFRSLRNLQNCKWRHAVCFPLIS